MSTPVSEKTTAPVSQVADPSARLREGRRLRAFAVWIGLLVLCFWRPLADLARLSLKEELYSHVFLVPVISGYLVWTRRTALPPAGRRSWSLALVFLLPGLAALLGWLALRSGGATLAREDDVCLTILSFVCLVVSGAALIFGKERLLALLFPALFLVFMVPMPSAWTHATEVFFQTTSAEVSAWLFALTATPVWREGQVFRLPGIIIEVAEECSGVRSSYVLFMTCLLAGNLFLRRAGSRVALALVVIPLGIVRNAVRILTISLLCVHVDPRMIDSVIHRHGGPLFFVLSLVPLFLVLLGLRRWEDRAQAAPCPGADAGAAR